MTKRENFLAALRCGRVDQMPFVFTVDGFNYPVGTPEELLNPFDMVKIDRYLGSYAHDRLGPSPIVKTPRAVTVEATTLTNGDMVHQYTTPVGNLKARYTPSSEANTAFLVGHCVTTLNDYETLMAMIEDPVITTSQEGADIAKARMDFIGDDGIMYNAGPSTPIMDLTRVWVGLEKFIIDLLDYPDLVEKTMNAMAEKAYEEYELLASSTPVNAIVYWDDVTSAYISPDLFRRYVLPVYRNFADICHGHGKILVSHACGHLRSFLPLFLDSGIDAIDWVTPPDTGDVVFSEAQEIFDGRICIMGTLIPAVLRFGTPDEVEAHIHQVMSGVDVKKGFIFQVPPPIGTPMANVERVRQVVENCYWE
ncbi:MAG: uroporphyrinogen decarboxylase family protein [Armatimonadota bacterium]